MAQLSGILDFHWSVAPYVVKCFYWVMTTNCILKTIKTFIRQRCMKLNKSDSKDICNITKDF